MRLTYTVESPGKPPWLCVDVDVDAKIVRCPASRSGFSEVMVGPETIEASAAGLEALDGLAGPAASLWESLGDPAAHIEGVGEGRWGSLRLDIENEGVVRPCVTPNAYVSTWDTRVTGLHKALRRLASTVRAAHFRYHYEEACRADAAEREGGIPGEWSVLSRQACEFGTPFLDAGSGSFDARMYYIPGERLVLGRGDQRAGYHVGLGDGVYAVRRSRDLGLPQAGHRDEKAHDVRASHPRAIESDRMDRGVR